MINIGNVGAARHDSNVEAKLREALKAAGLSADWHDKVFESCRASGLFPTAHSSGEFMYAAAATAVDADAALASVPGFSAPLRHAVMEVLKAKGIVGGKPSVSAAASNRRTINAIADANPENIPVLQQIKATAARLGFNFKDDEQVDVGELNEALRGRDVGDRMALKLAMNRVGLIP